MRGNPFKQKVDPDAPGTPGEPGYEPPVKREDLDDKGKALWDKNHNKQQLMKSEKRKLTDRQTRIAKNKEFNAYAEKQGWKPPQPTTDEGVASYAEFFKNKDNVNMLNKRQAEYFKNKKK